MGTRLGGRIEDRVGNGYILAELGQHQVITMVRNSQTAVSAGSPSGIPRALAKDERGAVAVVAAIVFPVVVGAMGLGAETGYWYLKQRNLQHAADVAAHAGAGRLRAGDQKPALGAAAKLVASQTGYLPASGTLTIGTSSSPSANPGVPDTVEVVLTESHPRLFSSIFSKDPVTLRARAVAKVEQSGSTACVLALSKTGSGVTVSGSASVDLTGCSVASNSNAAGSFLMSGYATMKTDCVYTVGEAVTTTGLTLGQCKEVRENAPVSIDPYVSVPEPQITGTCKPRNQGSSNGTTALTPTETHPSGVKVMHFCNGLNVKGTVIFGPGLYIIEGGSFTANSSDPNSASSASLQVGPPVNSYDGVTFYLKDSALDLRGNVSLDLKAPTSGPYSGILFFGSRSQTGISHTINGTSDSTLTGAVYTPAAAIAYKGNSTTTNGCTQLIADTITFIGNSTMKSTCDSAGTRELLADQRVSLIE